MTGDREGVGVSVVRNDPENMMGRVADFANQLREAASLAAAGPDLLGDRRPSRIYVVGMGGSAIGGDFLRARAQAHCSIPVEVVRGYSMPAACDVSAFAFFVSYSGNTEETLACWDEAAQRGVPRAAITSGGELARRADADGTPALIIPPGSPPRAALGWTSVPLLLALERGNLLSSVSSEVSEAASACENVLSAFGPGAGSNSLSRWANSLVGKLPIVYAPVDPYFAVATRWVCQFNENAKSIAHTAFVPEQNHNEVVGWEVPSPVLELARVAFLLDDRTHPRVRKRMEIVASIVESSGSATEWFEPRGESLTARLYSFATMGDLASVYLAGALGIDPTPVASIDRLKAELGSPP